MSILIAPSRSLPPPRQWSGSAARPVRLLDASRHSAAHRLRRAAPPSNAQHP